MNLQIYSTALSLTIVIRNRKSPIITSQLGNRKCREVEKSNRTPLVDR